MVTHFESSSIQRLLKMVFLSCLEGACSHGKAAGRALRGPAWYLRALAQAIGLCFKGSRFGFQTAADSRMDARFEGDHLHDPDHDGYGVGGDEEEDDDV